MVLSNCALIHEAFVHVNKQQQGASLVQIRKHLEAMYEEKLDARKKKFIFSTFKSLILEGKLLQKGTIYKSTQRQRAIVRTDIPKRRHHRRRHHSSRRRHSRRRHHRRRGHSRRRHNSRRRHHRRRGHHRIHIRKNHHRKFKGRRHKDELPEPPDYTNSVPSVEVPDGEPPKPVPRMSSKRN